MSVQQRLGQDGEDFAASHLVENGYEILERNYRFGKAEIDIIARKGGVLAVVEVKTRSSLAFGKPEDFLKPAQIKNLVKVVNHYVQGLDEDLEVRFDIVALHKKGTQYSLQHFEDAFYHF